MPENEISREQDNSSSQPHGRGRPNAATQVEMEEKVWHYFSKGITSPRTMAELTGYDIKTARKILQKFAAIKLLINERGFVEECKIHIEGATVALDGLLLKLYDLYDFQKNRLSTPQNEFTIDSTCDQIRKTIDTIAKIITLKLAIANSPTADISMVRLAQEVLKKLGSQMAN
ncbi:MAG: hypothetical protein KGI19_02610 [Thaumarchaeota archaeon]|nr:hypothetical protein [Nitrososphaerota archaeon]